MTDKLKNFLIAQLRRISYLWPARSEALRLARIERGLYICNHCKKEVRSKEIQVDHVEPIIEVDKGFVSWDLYISRLFCNTEGFQILCKPCHSTKTENENKIRRKIKNEKLDT